MWWAGNTGGWKVNLEGRLTWRGQVGERRGGFQARQKGRWGHQCGGCFDSTLAGDGVEQGWTGKHGWIVMVVRTMR